MKKLLLIFPLLTILAFNPPNPISDEISDGWHIVNAKYSNNKESYAFYKINVLIESGQITKLDLGQDRLFQIGRNKEGYSI